MTTKTMIAGLLACAALGVMLAPSPAAAQASPAPSAASTAARVERDRLSIKAMAGDYQVRFDFRETAPFLADYTPIPPKLSGGHESVRVIADRPGFISLQHLLVVDSDDGKPRVIKHWRQDWVYEPAEVLTYAGPGRWTLTPVPAEARKGAWSQTVWQTDDSPRYGGVGRWTYDHGAARWTSERTWRPLARRDAIRKPPYDRYDSINRHALTPAGWVHEQDNSKIGPREGELKTFVHEDGVNTYKSFRDFPVDAAEAYWTKTRDYWAEVRKAWDRAIAQGRGVRVAEEAGPGSVTGPALMGWADEVAEGRLRTEEAAAKARNLIETTTRGADRTAG